MEEGSQEMNIRFSKDSVRLRLTLDDYRVLCDRGEFVEETRLASGATIRFGVRVGDTGTFALGEEWCVVVSREKLAQLEVDALTETVDGILLSLEIDRFTLGRSKR
jgi:uncharacterized protein YneR